MAAAGQAPKELAFTPNDSLTADGVECGDKMFGYVINNTNTPANIGGLALTGIKKGVYSIETIETSTGKRSMYAPQSTDKNNKLTIGDLALAPQQDVILVLTPYKGNAQVRSLSYETEQLLSLLRGISAKGTMFGHQDSPLYGMGWEYEKGNSDVKLVCGDFPAVMGFDLGDIELGKDKNLDDVPFDIMRDEIINQYKRGGIVTLSWHTNNPLTAGDAWDVKNNKTVESVLSDGDNHAKFISWVNIVADFINSLETEEGVKIPVLFRPWHEHTGSWFWWGQKLCSTQDYLKLWDMTFAAFNSRGLTNVLYAYSPGIEPETKTAYLERYPGDSIVDLIGFDYYHSRNADYKTKMGNMLDILTEIGTERNKPIAITETGYGAVPDSSWWTNTLLPLLQNYPLSYVLVWRNTDKQERHYFVPYPGQQSEKDFLDFYQESNVLFVKDLNSITAEK